MSIQAGNPLQLHPLVRTRFPRIGTADSWSQFPAAQLGPFFMLRLRVLLK